MDFVKALPKVNGKKVILTVVDRLSKAAHFILLGHPYMATTVARAFFAEVIHFHEIPFSIVTPCSLASFGRSCSGWQASSCR
jgi:hypothetical protein